MGLTPPCSLLWLLALGKGTTLRFGSRGLADGFLSIGMEIFKLPAGRLATVFYTKEPQEYQDGVLPKSDLPSEMEKGKSDETLQPIVSTKSRRSTRNIEDQLDRNGHSFAWKNISLDIKIDHGKKRLLDRVDGELATQWLSA